LRQHLGSSAGIKELPIWFTRHNFLFMPRTAINWETRIGRRLGVRDLHVFTTVAQFGSIEHTLGVRLPDRGPQGVELTICRHC
jgi:hypothetical protein